MGTRKRRDNGDGKGMSPKCQIQWHLICSMKASGNCFLCVCEHIPICNNKAPHGIDGNFAYLYVYHEEDRSKSF